MGWLLLIPFYFFGALSAFLALSLIARALRLKAGANALAVSAILLALAAVALPLITDLADLSDYAGRRMLLLAAVSLVLALLDTLLEPLLPLPLDKELAKL